MTFVPSIYEKRHEFYLNFANAFFVKEFWEKVLNDNEDKVREFKKGKTKLSQIIGAK